ncbi:MAG: type III pantothenate kinase [Oscillospiraceae bacterium]|jgi:type III pantothenate kinase|nr:type III pantothenate kinase [Oscillospiraceae bacterium]
MILGLDIGNTHIVIGCMENGEILNVFRMASDSSKTEDEYAVEISGVLKFHDVPTTGITGSVISCVVPPLTSVFSRAIKMLTGVDSVIVGAGIKTGLNILIDDPGTLAADMVSAAVGALAAYAPPLIIVDLGTATKMFVINKNGAFIGGAIMPGVSLSMNALSAGASLLPLVPIDAPRACISTNTVDCMKSGATYGAAAMVDGMIQRFEEELGEPATIVATGGIAEPIYRHCRREIAHDPYLILRGLWAIYEKNRAGSKQTER